MFARVIASLVLGAALVAAGSPASNFTNVCVSATNLSVDRNKLKNLVDVLLVDSPALTATDIYFIGNCTCAGYAFLRPPHALAGDFPGAVAVFTTGVGSQSIAERNTRDAFTGMFRGMGGDEDLTAYAAQYWDPEYPVPPSTREACGVKFTSTVRSSVSRRANIHFQYVFASEEYPGYDAEVKHDIFAFFVEKNNSGVPKTNVATVTMKGEEVPVTIHSVSDSSNADKFNANYFDSPSFNIEYDGFTAPLRTKDFFVTGRDQVNFKLVIADVGDNRFDSAVYIRAPIAMCGDGLVQADEECDDGNSVNDDGCSNLCRLPYCGDGMIQKSNGEQCEKSLLPADQQCSCSRWCQNLPHGCGDPHILSFDGADFMFVGWPNATFNMLTHSTYQINTYFRKYPHQDADKTWIGAIGMKIGSTDRIEISGAGMGAIKVKVNGNDMHANTKIETPAYVIDYVGDIDGGKEVLISTPDIVVGVSIEATNWNLDFEVQRIANDMGPVHGILGQSYSRMMEQKDDIAHGRTPDQPVNGVEGTDADYNVASGLFGDDFKYNLFTGTNVKLGASRSEAVQSASSSRKLLSLRAGYY